MDKFQVSKYYVVEMNTTLIQFNGTKDCNELSLFFGNRESLRKSCVTHLFLEPQWQDLMFAVSKYTQNQLL